MRGGGARNRGRAFLPPSVAAAIASSQRNIVPVLDTSTAARPSYPPPPPTTSEVLDLQSDPLKAIIEYSNHIQALLKATPFFIEGTAGAGAGAKDTSKPDKLERYSDKYVQKPKREKLSSIPTALCLFPEELVAAGNGQSTTAAKGAFSYGTILARLQEAETREQSNNADKREQETEANSEDDDEGSRLDDAVYEEEELEDETDYNLSYFDNGEDYGDYEGDDGEPSY